MRRLKPVPAAKARVARRARRGWGSTRLARLGFLLAGVLALAGALYAAWSGGFLPGLGRKIADRFLAMTTASGFVVDAVEVQGRGETPAASIQAALAVARGAPLMDLDLQAIRRRLIDLPWVVAATVERRYPDRLLVSLTEARPLALWQRQGRYHLIGQDGAIIAIDDVAPFRKLPLLVGAEAPQQAGAFLAMLEVAPDLRPRVVAAVLVSGRRWNLRLDNGVEVRLPEEDAASAWARLAAIERQHAILQRDISILDLRQADRIVVRQAHPPAIPAVKTGAGKGKSNET